MCTCAGSIRLLVSGLGIQVFGEYGVHGFGSRPQAVKPKS